MRTAAAFLLTLLVAAAPLFYQQVLRLPDTPLSGGVLDIPAGSSALHIGQLLREKHNLALPVSVFVVYARWQGVATKLKAGEYRLANGDSLAKTVERIVRGDVIKRRVTLIEGARWPQMIAALHRSERLKRTLDPNDESEVREALGLESSSLEAAFLPETYTYVAGASDRDILLQAHRAMTKLLAQEWEKRAADLPYKDTAEVLIVASLIEKETGHEQDRALIARVFVERLRRGMKMQSDPTVIYALGDAFDGNLRRVDLQLDHPYNTYLYAGLPPGPIAAPGAASIHAALHPAPGDYLFFVARGDGTSVFSRTLAEHNAAVNQFQRRRQAR